MNIKCEILYIDVCTARDHININKYGVGAFQNVYFHFDGVLLEVSRLVINKIM
jgi:hypothetical protein